MQNPFPAIVVPAWQRPQSLQRLLSSLLAAAYPEGAIPLVLSLEGEPAHEVRELVKSFVWPFGPLEVVEQSQRLGLREHILACGDLAERFGAVIVLEDDVLAGPGFYEYARHAAEAYAQESQVASIALYTYQHAEADWQPFVPMADGGDVYFLQAACSWGQLWTAAQWRLFRQFLSDFPKMEDTSAYPDYLNSFSEYSWKRHFSRYLHHTGRTVVYPRVAHATPFSQGGLSPDAGDFWQVPLQMGQRTQYQFTPLAQSGAKYDGWWECDAPLMREWEPSLPLDICINLRGKKPQGHHQWHLGANPCADVVRSWGNHMAPAELNIRLGINGQALWLCRITQDPHAPGITLAKHNSHPQHPTLSIGILALPQHTAEDIARTLNSIQTQWPSSIEVVISGQCVGYEGLEGVAIRQLAIGSQAPGQIWIRLVQALGNAYELVIPAGISLLPRTIDEMLGLLGQFPHVEWLGGNRSGKVPDPVPSERWSPFLFGKRLGKLGETLPLHVWSRELRHQIPLEKVENSDWPAGEWWNLLQAIALHHTAFSAWSQSAPWANQPANWRPIPISDKPLPLGARMAYPLFIMNIPYLRNLFLEGNHLAPVFRWDFVHSRWYSSPH